MKWLLASWFFHLLFLATRPASCQAGANRYQFVVSDQGRLIINGISFCPFSQLHQDALVCSFQCPPGGKRVKYSYSLFSASESEPSGAMQRTAKHGYITEMTWQCIALFHPPFFHLVTYDGPVTSGSRYLQSVFCTEQ